MDWLKELKADMERITREAAYKHWPPIGKNSLPYYNHRFEHVRQVEREAQRLMEKYGGDADIILASVWIHDRCKPQFDAPQHAENAANWAKEHLESCGFPAEKVDEVAYAVGNHVGWSTKGLDTLEAKILWDSDKLAHFGPSFMIQAMFAFTSEHICRHDGKEYSENFTLEGLIPELLKQKSENDNHSDPLKLLYFDYSRELYARKRAAVDAFASEFAKNY